MSVWVKVKDKSDDGNYNGAYSRIFSAPNSYYQMWLNWNNDGQNDREIYARSGGHGFEISSNNTITENTWKHVVYTFTSDTLKMYVDGTKVRTQYKSWSWNNGISNDGTLYIGSSSPNNNTFLGDLDNIRLYDRALTSDEITDLYSVESRELVSSKIKVAAGQTSSSIYLSAVDDETYEGDESVKLSIASVDNGQKSTSSTSVELTIEDNDGIPEVKILLIKILLEKVKSLRRQQLPELLLGLLKIPSK